MFRENWWGQIILCQIIVYQHFYTKSQYIKFYSTRAFKVCSDNYFEKVINAIRDIVEEKGFSKISFNKLI